MPDPKSISKAERNRINRSISDEVSRFSRAIAAVAGDADQLARFVKSPRAQLKAAGLDLAKYASSKVPAERLEHDVSQIVESIVSSGFAAHLRDLGVMEGTYSSRTETQYEYNFDHSTKSDYKYESHTGTERGTFSETSTGQATDTKTSFRGIDLQAYLDVIRGPLIAPEAMKNIVEQVKATLVAAEIQRVGK